MIKSKLKSLFWLFIEEIINLPYSLSLKEIKITISLLCFETEVNDMYLDGTFVGPVIYYNLLL